MFNNEEIAKLKAENENYKSQLELKEMQLQQLQIQLQHKNNEITDIVSDAFLGFRQITEIATRNDYGQPEQKVRQIKEYAETKRNYYAQLELDTTYSKKIELPITDQSNR